MPLAATLRPLAAALLLALGSASAQAPGDLRLALVIGNSAYPAPATLANPANDAKAMGDTLRGLGFTVTELRDATQAQMQDAIARVREQLQGKQGIGMLYYAGHGLQLDWRNYMVPVDAKLAAAADVPARTVDVNAVTEAFKAAGNRMNILVLDACRDNPFTGATGGKGLAQQDAPPGTILAYATAPGNVAADGTGANGLYTQFLLQELVKPQSKIEDVFKRTRFAVRKASGGKQIPWESTSLEEDFMFNAGKVVAAPRPDNRAKEQALAAEKTEWDKIRDSRSADDFYAFLARFPSGSYSEPAQARLQRLQKALATPQAGPDGHRQPGFESRFQEGDTYELVTRDGLTGNVVQQGTLRIRLIGEDQYESIPVAGNVPGAVGDRAGFVLRDLQGSYDPPWVVLPAGDFQKGKRMEGRAVRTTPRGQKVWLDYDARVVGRERISSAFGDVDAWRVDISLLLEDGLRVQLSYWYDEAWGFPLRTRTERRRGGAPDIQIRELIARSRKS